MTMGTSGLLDLSRHHPAVQQAQVILEHDCIHGQRHEKPQAIGTIGRGYQIVSVFLQQTQLSRVPVYAKQSAVCSHTG